VEFDSPDSLEEQIALVLDVIEIILSRKLNHHDFMMFMFLPRQFADEFSVPLKSLFGKYFGDDGFNYDFFTWDKGYAPPVGGDTSISPDSEMILYFNTGRPLPVVDADKNEINIHSSFLRYRQGKRGGADDCWKPVPLIEHLIHLATDITCRSEAASNQLILDPFCGSGATGIAAVNCSRDFLLIDSCKAQWEIARAKVLEAMQEKESSAA